MPRPSSAAASLDDLTAQHLPVHRGVEAFWESAAVGGQHRVLPDGCMDLLFELKTGQARVIGTMSRAVVVHLEPGEHYFGVRFRPGVASHFMGIRADELRDDDAQLTDVLANGAELTQRVLDAPNHRARRAVCIQHLRGMKPRGPALDHRVVAAAGQIQNEMGAVAVATIADQVGLSERQLERLFALHIGVRPKLFARVTRLQTALRLSQQVVSQARLSAAAGFADEPHLVREFKALAGCSLAELRRERDVGIVQDQPQEWD
jgi:AraC-like DNA-binding protein